MNERRSRFFGWLLGPVIVCSFGGQAHGQLCLQYASGVLQEPFNTLSASGTNNTTVPLGFVYFEAGSSGNLTYAADAGAGTAGNTYSYGTGTAAERAFGELTTNLVQSTIASCVVNRPGKMTSFDIGYTGEQWRLGAADASIDRLDFQYSLNAATAVDPAATWIDVDALDFTTPNNTTAGAKDGNAASNRTVIAPVRIEPETPIPPEGTLFFRWVPVDITGEDDGLAIDDFSFSAHTECNMDIDNNGEVDALTDALILLRATFGFTGAVVTTNALGPGAKRTSWSEIQTYLNSSCGTDFAP
jgi:hypothetical protein